MGFGDFRILLYNPFEITLGSRFMEKCGIVNVIWVCTQLFGLADLLQSGYGTCFVRISYFFELMISVKQVFSRNCYISCVFRTKSHNPNDRMDHGLISWFW